MAVTFDVPSSPKRSVAVIDEFLGVDFTNSPSNVDLKKEPKRGKYDQGRSGKGS